MSQEQQSNSTGEQTQQKADQQKATQAAPAQRAAYADSTRPEDEDLAQLKQKADQSNAVTNLQALQRKANESGRVHQLKSTAAALNEATTKGDGPVQRAENNTGLPDNLKSGIESLSGYSMDDVKVHRNSDKPAQLQAHAYAQGTDIHLGPGQEKHLPHEAWHVVQQKQGRVKPTMQMKGKVNVNDDAGLEKEADVMGAKALQSGNNQAAQLESKSVKNSTVQRNPKPQPVKVNMWGQEVTITLDDKSATAATPLPSYTVPIPDLPAVDVDWSVSVFPGVVVNAGVQVKPSMSLTLKGGTAKATVAEGGATQATIEGAEVKGSMGLDITGSVGAGAGCEAVSLTGGGFATASANVECTGKFSGTLNSQTGTAAAKMNLTGSGSLTGKAGAQVKLSVLGRTLKKKEWPLGKKKFCEFNYQRSAEVGDKNAWKPKKEDFSPKAPQGTEDKTNYLEETDHTKLEEEKKG